MANKTVTFNLKLRQSHIFIANLLCTTKISSSGATYSFYLQNLIDHHNNGSVGCSLIFYKNPAPMEL